MISPRPVRLQLSRRKGFDLQKLSMETNGLPAVNVARPSKSGNPFVVGQDGTREECVHLYEALFVGLLCLTSKATVDEQIAVRNYVIAHLDELRGKNLACWCSLHGPHENDECHADVLLALANREPAP